MPDVCHVVDCIEVCDTILVVPAGRLWGEGAVKLSDLLIQVDVEITVTVLVTSTGAQRIAGSIDHLILVELLCGHSAEDSPRKAGFRQQW